MIQHLCERCGELLINLDGLPNDGQRVWVGVSAGGPISDAYWAEYHRGCARDLKVEEVYNRAGLLPL